GQLRSQRRAELPLHAEAAVRGREALVRRARSRVVVRPHGRVRAATRRCESVRRDAVHSRNERAIRPVRMARAARRADRAHHADGCEVDVRQAAGADRRAMAGRVPRRRLRAGARRPFHPPLEAEDRPGARAAGRRATMTRWVMAVAVLFVLTIAAAAAQQPSGAPTDTDALEAASTKKHAIEADTE